jgi:3',5'-cyclic-AMP phosphodiesterase
MPIHLPPITRRQFLARSLAAGAGLAVSPQLFAAEKSLDENAWALLADPHIAADRTVVSRTVNMAGHFETVSRELIACPARPAGIFVVGDCAYNSGESNDYATLAGLLRPLREGQMPVHLALGNHDNRERFREALPDENAAARPLVDKQVALLRTPRVNWFVLDSLEKTLSVPGLLGEGQLSWLEKSLDENRDQPALVLIHHNPGTAERIEGVKDTEALFKIIRPRKQVKAWIFGHTHNWSVTRDDSGVHLINLPPVAYVFKEGNPSGWVLANVERNGMRLELRCVDQGHKAHGQVTQLEWRT